MMAMPEGNSRLFQIDAVAAGNERSPMVARRVHGATMAQKSFKVIHF